MALSKLQERVERSLFEVIRKTLVAEGYIPDISNDVRYPKPPTSVASANWATDIAAIKTTKGFAIEVFGHGSSQSKGTKEVPRIVIMSHRSMPSEIGAPMSGVIVESPIEGNLGRMVKMPLPYVASTFQFDIHLVSNTAAQDRILNAIIAKALSTVKYIPFLDDDEELFFIRQYNYYDIPDTQEGIEEKVYSYEVPDLYDSKGDATEVPLISEINLELYTLIIKGDFEEDETSDDFVQDGGLKIDSTGTDYNV